MRRCFHLLGGAGEELRFLDFLQLDQVNSFAGGSQAHGPRFKAKRDLIPLRRILAPPDQTQVPALIPAGSVLGVSPGQAGEILPRLGLAQQILGRLGRLPALGVRSLGWQGEQDLLRLNHPGLGVLVLVLLEVTFHGRRGELDPVEVILGPEDQVVYPGPIRQAKFHLMLLVIAGHRIVWGGLPGQELFRGHHQVIDVNLLLSHPEKLLKFRVRDLGKGGHFLNDLA